MTELVSGLTDNLSDCVTACECMCGQGGSSGAGREG